MKHTVLVLTALTLLMASTALAASVNNQITDSVTDAQIETVTIKGAAGAKYTMVIDNLITGLPGEKTGELESNEEPIELLDAKFRILTISHGGINGYRNAEYKKDGANPIYQVKLTRTRITIDLIGNN